jgi:uncharacterized flavoprotein (TIGR03862 family)
VIGGGPAGLMAAETLAKAGCTVTVFDQMPSLGRKFLMAGIGGLNLTHSEDLLQFCARYQGAQSLVEPIKSFPPSALRAWCEGLGEETFVGSSGRVFPKSFKASPLLRAWLRRLEGDDVIFQTRHKWRGWDQSGLVFDTPQGRVVERADALILALGGGSWPRLGSDGAWQKTFIEQGIDTQPFRPSNCGFVTGWHDHVGARFAGVPLKSVVFSFAGDTVMGEAVITDDGIEGGAIYALSANLRDEIEKTGSAVLHIDFKPIATVSELAEKLAQKRAGDSTTNSLRKLGLPPAAIAVLRESVHPLPNDASELAALIKSTPVVLKGVRPLARAISTIGGVSASAVDNKLMLTARPGVFVAGEMLDWEVPTGGYLLQGCFASGKRAAESALDWLRN